MTTIPLVITPSYLASISWPEESESYSDIQINAGTITLRDDFAPMIQANLEIPYSDDYWEALDPGHAPILQLDLSVPEYPLAMQSEGYRLIVREARRVKASETIAIRAVSYDGMLIGRTERTDSTTAQPTIFAEIQNVLDIYYVTDRDSVVVTRDPATLATAAPIATRPQGSSSNDLIEANLATASTIGIWRPDGNLLLQSSSVWQFGATDGRFFNAYDPTLPIDFVPLLDWEWGRTLDAGYADAIRLTWEDGGVNSTTVPSTSAVVIQVVEFTGTMPPGYVPAAGTANSILARMQARKERIQLQVPLMPTARPYDQFGLPSGWPAVEPGEVSGQAHIIREVTHDLVNATTTLTVS